MTLGVLSLAFVAVLATATAAVVTRDRDWLQRIAQGDMTALRAVYDTYGGRVMAIALRVLRRNHEAEEVVQDTFIELWNRAREYDAGRGPLQAWITTIARSRAIDRLRARKASARARDTFAMEPVDHPVVPLDLASARQARGKITEALSVLSPEQRRALELAFYEGLTQQEIADQTGDPLGTVKTRIRAAMAKLAHVLRDYDEVAS